MRFLFSLLVVFLMVGFVAAPAIACDGDCGNCGNDDQDGCGDQQDDQNRCDGDCGDCGDDQQDGGDDNGGCTGDHCDI